MSLSRFCANPSPACRPPSPGPKARQSRRRRNRSLTSSLSAPLFPDEAPVPVPAPPLVEIFDVLRQQFPAFGLALYALTPGGEVVLEVHHDGEVFTWTAASAAEAFMVAFPYAPPGNADVLA